MDRLHYTCGLWAAAGWWESWSHDDDGRSRLSGRCQLSAHACVQGILWMPYISSHKFPCSLEYTNFSSNQYFNIGGHTWTSDSGCSSCCGMEGRAVCVCVDLDTERWGNRLKWCYLLLCFVTLTFEYVILNVECWIVIEITAEHCSGDWQGLLMRSDPR